MSHQVPYRITIINKGPMVTAQLAPLGSCYQHDASNDENGLLDDFEENGPVRILYVGLGLR